MASTPEKRAKRRVDDLLKQYPIYFFPPNMAGFGKSGVPDRVGCHRGLFFGVEVKADTDVTALQQRNLDDIVASGGKAFLVRINDHVTEGYDELEQWLKEVESKYEAYRQITAPAVRATPDTDSKDTASVHAGLRWRTAT